MNSNFDKIIINILWINCCVFYVGFIFGPTFYRFNPDYLLANNLIFYKIFIFSILLLLSLLHLFRGKISKNGSIFYALIFALGLYALFVGLIHCNSTRFLLTHAGNYLVFFMGVYLSSNIRLDKDYLFANAKKYINFLGLFSIVTLVWVIVNATYEGSFSFSLSLYGLGFVLAYYLADGKKLYSLLYVFVTLLCGKRALFVAAILILFAPFKLQRDLVTTKNNTKARKLLPIFVTVLIILMFVVLYNDIVNKIIDNLILRMMVQDVGIDTIYTIDFITSGRLTDFHAVISTLIDNNMLFTGFGYGAAYDSYAYTSTFDHASIGHLGSWYKSGSDIQPAHYILQYGIVFGLLIYLTHIILLLVCLSKSKNDKWHRFITLTYMFYLIASLFTFIPADPAWGLLVGILLRYSIYKKNPVQIGVSRQVYNQYK